MADTLNLLPCPFCGSDMKIETIADVVTGPGEVFVQCDCGAMGPGSSKDLDDAIAKWNRRAATKAAAPADAEDLKLKLRTLFYAATAVIERWDSPLWKGESTAALIARLREATNTASSNCRASSVPAIPGTGREKTCTCPSGDGSLRWPCPVHPSEAKAGGEA